MGEALVIGIAGGTGSGKTTLMKALVGRFGDSITMLSHDNYYKAHDELPLEERALLNYDCPEAFDTPMLVGHLQQLKQGLAIACPVYDFSIHNRTAETTIQEPRPVILVEGILIFENAALCREMDVKIFVDAEADIRLARRIRRDVRKRGRSLESVVEQYLSTVKPMHERYVEPSKKNADLVVLGGGKNPVALELIAGRIQQHLQSEPGAHQ